MSDIIADAVRSVDPLFMLDEDGLWVTQAEALGVTDWLADELVVSLGLLYAEMDAYDAVAVWLGEAETDRDTIGDAEAIGLPEGLGLVVCPLLNVAYTLGETEKELAGDSDHAEEVVRLAL